MENTPDGNGKEQTVRSLIFAPMLHVMSETNANDCHICVVCASDVLDKFFVQRVLVFRLRINNLTTVMFETQTSFDDVFDDSGNFQVWRSLEISSRIGWEFVGC